MNDKEIKLTPIDGRSVDYAAWGANCAKLKLDAEQVQKMIESFGERHWTVEQRDTFWTGFHETVQVSA